MIDDDEALTLLRVLGERWYGLKALPRRGWVLRGVAAPESVAAHAWGVATLALLLCPPEVNRERAMAMALLHDLAEVVVGDVTPVDPMTPGEKHVAEWAALQHLLAPLPQAQALAELWQDFEAGQSAEARWVRSLDKVDMALQALRYAREAGLDAGEFLASAAAGLQVAALEPLLAALVGAGRGAG